MEATVSTAFIYAILGGVLSVFSLIYYQKTKDPEFKRKPIYYAGIFFIVAFDQIFKLGFNQIFELFDFLS